MKLSLSALIALFSVSFVCFLLGWLFAVFVLPGEKLNRLAERKHSEPAVTEEQMSRQSQDQSFLEEIKNNVLILFDPYKMDDFVKKETKLGQDSFIKKTADSIVVKKNIKAYSPPPAPKTDLRIIEAEKKLSALPAPPVLPERDSKLTAIQEEYDERNRKQLALIEKGQKFFKSNGKFSFMVNVFSDQEKAFKYINTMKEQYPMWSFLLKIHKDHIRVYLGPFPSKELAEEFKKSIPMPSPFSSLEFLEELSL